MSINCSTQETIRIIKILEEKKLRLTGTLTLYKDYGGLKFTGHYEFCNV